jgi:hypothetical protein
MTKVTRATPVVINAEYKSPFIAPSSTEALSNEQIYIAVALNKSNKPNM